MNDHILEIFFINIRRLHCVKRVLNRSFSGKHFHVFKLNTEIYRENLVFNPSTRKYGAEKTSNFDTFQAMLNWR